MLTVAMNNQEFESYHKQFICMLRGFRDKTMTNKNQNKRHSEIPEDQKNGLHVQWYEQNGEAFEEMISENPTAARIFSFLSRYMDNKNAVVCPSAVLEEAVGKKRTTVSKAISYLRDNKWIMVIKSGNTNVYVLNPNVVWKAWRGGKSYCEFEGPILISKKENAVLSDTFKSFTQKSVSKRN